MKPDEPCLGEALTEERTWEADGIPVLTASVTLPQLAGTGSRVRRFNGYYRRFCRAYLAYCRQLLLPEAAESCRTALASSAPWEPARAELRFRAERFPGPVLSVVSDANERIYGQPAFQLRRSEVWDLAAGLPLPLEEFFPPHTRCRQVLLRFARAELLRRAENGAALRENWRFMLRWALSLRSFYLSARGLCFYYPLGSLAPRSEGIPTFTLPYQAERGPFLSSSSPQRDRHSPASPAPR